MIDDPRVADDLDIPAPLLIPGVHRLALLSGLQAALIAGQPIGFGPLAEALGHALRDLRTRPDWDAWGPALRYLSTSVEFAIELLLHRAGSGQVALAGARGSARYVVDKLNTPLVLHATTLATARVRAEQAARRHRELPAAASAALERAVVELATMTADLARWWQARGTVPVISPNGQIASMPAALVQAGRIHATLLRVAELCAAGERLHDDA